MKRLLHALALALVGVVAIGLAGGDPRAAASLEAATRTSLAGLTLAIAVGLGVWAFPRERRSLWLLLPMVMVAVFGALSDGSRAPKFWASRPSRCGSRSSRAGWRS